MDPAAEYQYYSAAGTIGRTEWNIHLRYPQLKWCPLEASEDRKAPLRRGLSTRKGVGLGGVPPLKS